MMMIMMSQSYEQIPTAKKGINLSNVADVIPS